MKAPPSSVLKKAGFLLLAATVLYACSKGKEEPGPVKPGNDTELNAVPIGKSFSGANAIDFTNKNAAADYFAGEHEVAIYRTPDGKTDEIGKGKLVISRNGNLFTMKLTGANGSTLSTASVDLTNTSDYNYETLIKAGAFYNIGASERANNVREDIKMAAVESGAFSGEIYTEGTLRYKFRNNVEHFGLKAPGAIASLKGTWEGPHMQPLCQPNPVTVIFAADGTVMLKGKAALSCAQQEVAAKWDGQDDFVEPDKTGWNANNTGSMIYLDAGKSGGSQPGGGIRILIPQLKDPAAILEVQSYTALNGGNILVEKPAKK